jgi:cytochrome c-type biogenesis protein
MQELLAQLTHAVEGTPAVALTAAMLWGILSILLSPCHLASIPLIIGFVGEQGGGSTRRAFTLSLLFSVGILVTIALIGVLTAAAGRLLGDLGPYANYAVALIFFVVGLHLLDVIPLPCPPAGPANFNRKGLLAALMLGLVFGLALGPCTFAYMAPMLALTFKVAAAQFGLRRAAAPRLRDRPLLRDRAGRYLDRVGGKSPALEQGCPRCAHPEKNMRLAGPARRPLAALYRAVVQAQGPDESPTARIVKRFSC